jgi:putative copper export protein
MEENNKDTFRMKFLKIFLGVFLFSLGIQAQTEKVDKQSLLWTRYYNQLELNKNGLFILKLIIGFYKSSNTKHPCGQVQLREDYR